MEEYIQKVIAPKLQGDGGWIRFITFEDGVLRVMLQGECSKCGITGRCMEWLKGEIQRDLGLQVAIVADRKKPFFWDL